jgi:multicomponent Na+:H+ antiporter subunit E
VTFVRVLVLRAAILSGGWWVFTEGDRGGIAFGVPVVGLALVTSLWLSPPARQPWRPFGLARFAAYFLFHSVRGGVDVARRALSPRLPLSPGVRAFPVQLPHGPARDVFAATLSLMPGTLVVDRGEDTLFVHTLADTAQVDRDLAALEVRVAHAMGPTREAGDG